MKLPQALFSYTKKLMTSFLAGHSGPGGEAISKLAQVCVVSENMVHGRGQSLALSWHLLRIGFLWRTQSAHLCWSPPLMALWDTLQSCGCLLSDINKLQTCHQTSTSAKLNKPSQWEKKKLQTKTHNVSASFNFDKLVSRKYRNEERFTVPPNKGQSS